jgi:hypothetical protein
MLPHSRRATLHGEAVLLRGGVHTPAKPARHALQMGIVQMVLRAEKLAPPLPKASRIVAERKVGVEDNAIHTVVAAFKKLAVTFTQKVGHGEVLLQVDHDLISCYILPRWLRG